MFNKWEKIDMDKYELIGALVIIWMFSAPMIIAISQPPSRRQKRLHRIAQRKSKHGRK